MKFWLCVVLLLCTLPALINCIIITFCTQFLHGKPEEYYQQITGEAWYFNKWLQLASLICLCLVFYGFMVFAAIETKEVPQYEQVQTPLYQRI